MSFLRVLADMNIAQDIDIDGLQVPKGRNGASTHAEYLDFVAQARFLLRRLEVSVQFLYENGSSVLLSAQLVPMERDPDFQARKFQTVASLTSLMEELRVELQQIPSILHNLMEVGRHQVSLTERQGFRGSMEWRSSQFNPANGPQRFSNLFADAYDDDGDDSKDYVDMNFALQKAGTRPVLQTVEGLPSDMPEPIPEEPEQESLADDNLPVEESAEDTRLNDALTKAPLAQPSSSRIIEEEIIPDNSAAAKSE